MKCRLGEILKERGIKQIWLAEQVGIHKTNINNLVSGKTEPKLATAYSIAEVLGLSVYDIWTKE